MDARKQDEYGITLADSSSNKDEYGITLATKNEENKPFFKGLIEENRPKFDKLNFAQMMLGLMTGNPSPLALQLLKKTASDIPGAVSSAYSDISQGIRSIPRQPVHDVAGAASDVGSGLLNIPGSIPKFLGESGVIPEEYGNKIDQYIPKVPTLSHEGETPGDKLLRETLPWILPAKNISTSAIKGGYGIGKKAINLPSKIMGKQDPLLALKSSEIEKLIAQQEEDVSKLKKEAREQEKSYKDVSGESKRLTNMAEPNSMEFSLNRQKKDIISSRQKTNELVDKLQSIEPPPEEPIAPEERQIKEPEKRNILEPEKPNISPPESPKKTSYEHVKEAEKAADKVTEFQDMVDQAKEHNENVSNISDQSDKAIGDYLNLGKAHHVRVGEYIKNKFKELGDKLKEDYGKKVKEVEDSGIEIPTSKIYRPKKSKNEIVKSVLVELPTKSEVKASTVMSRYKDLKREIYNLGQRAKFTESARERDSIFEALPELRKVSSSFKKILEDGLGEHSKDFKKLNERYSDYYDLKENRTRKAATKTGKISKSMADQLSGSEVGQESLRNMIKEEPEMVKHVIGQVYEKPSGRNNVHNPNEILSEYTEQLPELKNLLESKNQAELAKKESENHLENTKKKHEEAKRHATRLSNAAIRAGREESRSYKEYSERKRDYDKQMSSYEKDKKQYERDLKQQAKDQKDYESELSKSKKEKEDYKEAVSKHEKSLRDHEIKVKKAEKEIEDHKSDIENMEKRSGLIEQQMNKLREELNRKNIKLEEKYKGEQKLLQLKKESKQIDKDLSNSTTGLKSAILMAKTLYKFAVKFKRFY